MDSTSLLLSAAGRLIRTNKETFFEDDQTYTLPAYHASKAPSKADVLFTASKSGAVGTNN
jgi:hypothetical protein